MKRRDLIWTEAEGILRNAEGVAVVDEQAMERMVNAELKQITMHILEAIRASVELSDEALLERRDNLRQLVELYASDWETRFSMLTTGFMLATEAIAKFFSERKLNSPMEALEQILKGREIEKEKERG